MTIEEKAKRYDETLEQLKGLIEGTREDKCAIVEEDIIGIFPELAESEDERIRKLIKLCLAECVHNDVIRDYEEQKALAWLEKQGEKPKWSEGDEISSDETIELLEYFINYAPEFRKPAIGRSVAWLNSIKQRLGGEK